METMEMGKSYFERFAEIMGNAKSGKFIPVGKEDILQIGLGDGEEWTEEVMVKWFTDWQNTAKMFVQVKE